MQEDHRQYQIKQILSAVAIAEIDGLPGLLVQIP